MTIRRMIAAVSVGLTALLTGCSNAPVVQGKVIPGNLSFVAVVDKTDARMATNGLSGVSVVVRNSGRGGAVVVAETGTDEKGNFTLKVRDSSAFMRPVEFAAEAPGYQPARGEMSLPSADRRLLIILTPGSRRDAGKPGVK